MKTIIECSYCGKLIDSCIALDLANHENLCVDCWYTVATNSGMLGLLDYVGSMTYDGAKEGMNE